MNICTKCGGPTIQGERGLICANWVECDGQGLSVDKPDVTLNAAERFAKNITPIIEAFRQMAEAFKSLSDFRDIQSAKWYEMAGRPYGNNTRGKKRWLREMKQK